MKKVLISFIIATMGLFASHTIQIDDYFEKNGLIMLLINPTNGQIVKANEKASHFYGYSKTELEKMSIQDLNTFTKQQVQKELQSAKKENRNYFIFRHKLSNGQIKRVEVYSQPITYNKQTLLFSTIHDVSNLELAQKAIATYSQKLEEQVDIKTKKLIQEEKNLRNLFIFGFIVQLLITLYLIRTNSRRKRAEIELEKSLKEVKLSEEKMKNIIDSFPIPISRAGKDFINIDFFNQSFYNLFGWKFEDINTIEKWEKCAYPNEAYRKQIFQEWFDLVEETNNQQLLTSTRPILANIQCKNGDTKQCQLWYHNNDNDIYGIFYDVTNQQRLEKENLEQQKMLLTQSKIAAVGEMLGNIAHQWRQPLSIISTQVSGMKVSLEFNQTLNKEMVMECSHSVLQQVKHLSSTIDDFKNFFTSDSESIDEFDIKESINKLHALVKDSLSSNYIDVHFDLESIFIFHNENKLIQALLNLSNNAKDAMVLNNVPTDERYLFFSVKQKQNTIVLSIKDSGGGIPEEVIDKIFEPYFTTKHQSIGTGIGLYMTYQIVTASLLGSIHAHNVEYEFEGKKLKGAEFILEFPIN